MKIKEITGKRAWRIKHLLSEKIHIQTKKLDKYYIYGNSKLVWISSISPKIIEKEKWNMLGIGSLVMLNEKSGRISEYGKKLSIK